MISHLKAINHLMAFLLGFVAISCSSNGHIFATNQQATQTTVMVKYNYSLSGQHLQNCSLVTLDTISVSGLAQFNIKINNYATTKIY